MHLIESVTTKFFAVCILACFVFGHECTAEETRPNIIIIMADDMGYSDIGCYGGEIQTPALDNLAENGIRFTQFYNTSRCCPTRASLLTGLYPHLAGVGWMMSDNGHDGYRGDLNNRCMTIGEVLKTAGYNTYMSGKWHVTKQVKPNGSKANWPRQRGFDRFYGTIHGAGSFFDPNSLTRDNTQIAPDEENFYYTDAITNNAIKFVKEHKTDDPFFMYVAYTAPHWPMHALPEDIRRYKGMYSKGWDAVRAERYMRMQKMGLLKPEWKLNPRDEGISSWRETENKAWHEKRMEVYAAMVDRMDLGIGRIVKNLKEQKKYDNTLILFLADNGGCAEEYGSSGPKKPAVGQRVDYPVLGPDELQTRMQPLMTRDALPVRTGYGVMPGPADTYVAYGKGWANVSNTPFRMYKHWVHEGGISSPLIAHWPKKISRKGEFESQPGHLVDLMATCVDVAKATYPKKYKDQEIHPASGKSLVPAFFGKDIQREDAIYWEHEGNRAARLGKWKIVAKNKQDWELYDMQADRSESNNLAETHPEILKQLADKWEDHAKRSNVYPLTPYANRNRAAFSKKEKFTLKLGDNLSQNKAPMIRGKRFVITSSLKTEQSDGIILAQGGTAHGFALYFQKNKLHFAVRRDGELTEFDSQLTLKPDAENKIRVEFFGKRVEMELNGQKAEKKMPGRLGTMPVDGLQVGTDTGGLVGNYPESLQLKGEISVEFEIIKK